MATGSQRTRGRDPVLAALQADPRRLAQGHRQPVVSPPILDEYRRVGEEPAAGHEGVDLSPFLSLLAVHAEIIDAPPLPSPVCSDRDDDKFIACALAGGVSIIVSGDKTLLIGNPSHGNPAST